MLAAPDFVATPTELFAYELPWDGTGSVDTRLPLRGGFLRFGRMARSCTLRSTKCRPFASRAEWAAAEHHRHDSHGPARVGGVLFDRADSLDIELVSPDFALDSTSLTAIAGGANMALIGSEVLQFLAAEQIDPSRWRISGLLRGRGGTEPAAIEGSPAGAPFALLDDTPVAIDQVKLGEGVTIAAIGLADPEPVYRPSGQRRTRHAGPLAPVHGARGSLPDGSVMLNWCRRSRGSWLWLDGVEVPLNEQAEAYLVGHRRQRRPDVRLAGRGSQLEIDAASWASLVLLTAGKPLWVRQVGTAALSPPMLLTTLA